MSASDMKRVVTLIEKDTQDVLSKVNSIQVRNDVEMTQAGELLSKVKDRLKRVEEKRKEYVQPLNDQVKKINGDFKSLAEPYVKMERDLKSAIGTYVTEQQRIERERVRAEEEARREEARKIAEKENISNRKALAQIEKPVETKVVTSVKTETAKVVTKTVTKFEIVDPSKVPDDYKVVSEQLVRKAVNSGIKKIAGVKIYEETQVSAF